MAYTPGFDYDIFISFSHEDNTPRPGQDGGGWVEEFARYLEWWLGKRCSLTGFKVWLDKKRLSGATEFDDRTRQDLGHTALLVVIHSHNYRKAKYCEKELGWFIETAKSQPFGLAVNNERRIFNVLINNIPYKEWTDADHWTWPFSGMGGFSFHDAGDDPEAFGYPIEDPDSEPYDAAMRPIVDAAARLLQAFPAPQGGPKTPPTTDQPEAKPGYTIVIDPHRTGQHYGFELEKDLNRREPDLELAVTSDRADPSDRWTRFEASVKNAQGLIIPSGNVDWAWNRIERAVKIAAVQPGEDMRLKNVWVLRSSDSPSQDIRQPRSSLSSQVRVQVLDSTDTVGIMEAVEDAVKPRDEEERTENRLPASNPFVGLRPFGREDSGYYFGRDAQIRTLLGLLHRNRFLAVIGSSGCGKSSLIRAGLIPALEAGFLVRERDRWWVVF